MSLINQMLKDLEARSTQPAQREPPLMGLPFTVHQKKTRKKHYLLLLALLCCVSIWGWNLLRFYHNHHLFSAKSVAINGKQPAVLPPATKAIEGSPEHAALTGISMQTHGKMTNLRFLLDRAVFYQVDSDPLEHSITLSLKRTRLTVNPPPLDYAHSALNGVQLHPEKSESLKIVFLLKPEAKLSNLELNKESKYPELQVDFLMETPASLPTEAPAEDFERSPSLKKASMESSQEERYQQALHLAEAGQSAAAVRQLSSLLQRNPSDARSREALITLLAQQGNRDQAEMVLADGLRLEPYYPPFLQIKARFLVDHGKVSQALSLLKKAPPALLSYPEYYAFLAALYQRLGQLPAAENIYQQLTMLHPEKGVWWLGLGVTEEGLGKNAQAMEAYARADNSADLDPELRGYVGTRLRG